MKHIGQLCLAAALILGNYQGYIALMDNGTPVETYSVQVRMLPREDQARLDDGIPISDPDQLEKLLQDYLS